MTPAEIKAALMRELHAIAPEIDLDAIDPDDDLRDAMEIDSVDFLTLIGAIDQRLGIEVAEADYPHLETISGAVAYLDARLKDAS